VFAGDFNSIRNLEERKGIREGNANQGNFFIEHIEFFIFFYFLFLFYQQ